jgi:NADH-quinone oxidoreductase subunit H
LCFLSISFFLGSSSFLLKIIFLCFFFVWVRCCYPRYRYDFLIDRAWLILLPFSLFFLLLGLTVFF